MGVSGKSTTNYFFLVAGVFTGVCTGAVEVFAGLSEFLGALGFFLFPRFAIAHYLSCDRVAS
jgi:hypothetical protein